MNATLRELVATSRDVLKFRPRFTSRSYHCARCGERKNSNQFDTYELIQLNIGITGICKSCSDQQLTTYKVNINTTISDIQNPRTIKEILDYQKKKKLVTVMITYLTTLTV